MEEWDAFLAQEAATQLGLAGRFLLFHSAPRLDKAASVLDGAVYSAAAASAEDAGGEPLLQSFLGALWAIEEAHAESLPTWDKLHGLHPYYIEAAALPPFMENFDRQVAAQELSYLFHSRAFSMSGKLKSLPLRVALILHKWEQGSRRTAVSQWSRDVSKGSMECGTAVFDYLSRHSDLLASKTSLFEAVVRADMAAHLAENFPPFRSLSDVAVDYPTSRLCPCRPGCLLQ